MDLLLHGISTRSAGNLPLSYTFISLPISTKLLVFYWTYNRLEVAWFRFWFCDFHQRIPRCNIINIHGRNRFLRLPNICPVVPCILLIKYTLLSVIIQFFNAGLESFASLTEMGLIELVSLHESKPCQKLCNVFTNLELHQILLILPWSD